jgi:hypothetical protein
MSDGHHRPLVTAAAAVTEAEPRGDKRCFAGTDRLTGPCDGMPDKRE